MEVPVKFEGKENAKNIKRPSWNNDRMGKKKGVISRRIEEDSERGVWPRSISGSSGGGSSSVSLGDTTDDDDDEFIFDEEALAQDSSSSLLTISSDGSPLVARVPVPVPVPEPPPVETQQTASSKKNSERLASVPPSKARSLTSTSSRDHKPPKLPTRFHDGQTSASRKPQARSEPPKPPPRSKSAGRQRSKTPPPSSSTRQNKYAPSFQLPGRSKSAHPSSQSPKKRPEEPDRTAPLRTASYTSAGVIFNFNRTQRRPMQTTNGNNNGKTSMEELESRLRQRAAQPQTVDTAEQQQQQQQAQQDELARPEPRQRQEQKQQQQQHPRQPQESAPARVNINENKSAVTRSVDDDDDDALDSADFSPDVDVESNSRPPPLRRISAPSISPSDFGNKLSSEDIEICRRLDEEYERALEEREIGYNARYSSVRQSAFLSVFFMVAYLFLGTAFFQRQTAWTIPDALLFSIYTITTVGYGRGDIPTTPGFQSYTIFYILVGIAALTIMVAQVYQCVALEASRAQHGRDKTEMARRGLDILTTSQRNNASRGNVHGDASADEIIAYHNDNMPGVIDSAFRCYDRAKSFFRDDEIGRSISVVFPFAGLILVGALVVGPIEGWTFLESVYFSVVSLTTVGFGDYVPTDLTSIWFCVLWLPFSVGFMSLYLGNVAAFYIRLSDRNIQRIERQMRRRVTRAKEKAERERAEVLRRAYRGQEVELEAVAAASEDDASTTDGDALPSIPPQHAKSVLARRKNRKAGFETLQQNDPLELDDGSDTHSLFGSTPLENMSGRRRQRILENSSASMGSTSRPDGRTMQSMRDIVRAVRRNLTASQKPSTAAAVVRSGPDLQFMSIRSTQTMPSHTMLRRAQRRKPSFALRVLVQERFAEIIATEIAGFQSSIEIKDHTLSVTIDSMQGTADKWLIPRRARKAFRAVAFEVLYFVGEHGLITRGADALYDLSPFEFHGLFSPLVAAMGDAETMEGWLASTDILADVDLRRDGTRPGLTPVGASAVSRLTTAQQERMKNASNRNLNETLNHTKLKKISPGSAFQA